VALFDSSSGKHEQNADATGRMPPGQSLTTRWPVLHYGSVPRIDVKRWRFRIFGLVEEPIELTFDQFMDLPKVTITRDIHCVTAWSRFDTIFEGVPFREVYNLIDPKPEAQFAMIHAEYGFTTNLPLADLLRDDVIFAHRADGADLTPEHGWPLRLVVPHLYFWKSAKWVRGLELLATDRPGFWESHGYHMRGDPWREERYS
jgi:DMSO/TMAO reductase YedYZ molybdopterin-dependent catalytic subunit